MSPTSPQRILGIIGHGIGLVQDDQLVARIEHGPSGGKVHDRSSDNAYTTVIGCIQLQDHGIELGGGIELFGTGKDCAGLAGSRRAIEQQVG